MNTITKEEAERMISFIDLRRESGGALVDKKGTLLNWEAMKFIKKSAVHEYEEYINNMKVEIKINPIISEIVFLGDEAIKELKNEIGKR